MWPKLGFVPIGEKPGRSAAGSELTTWCYTLAADDQLTLFQAKILDEALDIAIDTQIFIALGEPNSDIESEALFSDFMANSLNVWITNEILVEIDRNRDKHERKMSLQKTYDFLMIEHDQKRVDYFETVLKEILPSETTSQQSDIRHLAKTAASDVNIFVTKDKGLLKKSDTIYNQINLQIVSPVELIVDQHELLDDQAYDPTYISGRGLKWRRLKSEDLTSFPFVSFLIQREKKSKFNQILNLFLANPQRYESEILIHENKVIAIRVQESNDNILAVHFVRLASPLHNRLLFERFLVFNTIFTAVKRNLDMVKIEASSLAAELIPHLKDTGFVKCDGVHIRFCFAKYLDYEQTLSAITKLYPKATSDYQNMPEMDLQRCCSPLSLDGANTNFFLVPIKPGYAISLVDTDQSAQDLFGGNNDRLLRWDNVYYRGKNHHKILKAPARILWYVTGDKKEVVAVSHLDDVVIDTPKALYKKYKKLGILEWKDLYEICDGDDSREIMALKFSHTFPFRHSVSLNELRAIYEEYDRSPSLQSPSKVPKEIVQKIFQRGY
ncbi:hypothetical protein NKDENANG_03430 [Candidatus Entotheonellaceae bacterium PAL068K]